VVLLFAAPDGLTAPMGFSKSYFYLGNSLPNFYNRSIERAVNCLLKKMVSRPAY